MMEIEEPGSCGHMNGYTSMLTNRISYTMNHLDEIMPEYTADTENPMY